jgi:hypothetical protein
MNHMNAYPIADISAEDIQKITQAENDIKAASGKSVILIAYKSE